jgi:RHS repeat-associated protein
VTCLLTPYQQLAAKYLYDPYGNLLAMYGWLAGANLYRFSSKEWDGNAGMYYYLYRFYDPNLQRWPNRDPYEELGFLTLARIHTIQRNQSQLYFFVKNDPLDKIDYLGLDCCPSPRPTPTSGRGFGSLIDAAWEAAKAATPGGEFVSAFEVFGSCNSLGLALAWARTQYNDCIADALCGPPSQDSAAEKACGDKWNAKIKLLSDTYDKECKGTSK